MIRILLGQKGTLLRSALATFITQQDGMMVIAQSATREEVTAVAGQQDPNVAVLDHELPGTIAMSDLCHSLCERIPSCSVLLVVDSQAALGLGVVELAPRVGMIATDSTPEDFVTAVRTLAVGKPVLDPAIAVAAITAKANPLTRRETEVLRLASNGAPSKDIAARMFLSPGTVNNYLSRIICKTGARSRMEAVHIASSSGWI